MTYSRFAAMIATSVLVMFGLMYLNTYAWNHLYFSETRVYMAILMGAAMATVMLAFMFDMYPNRRLNWLVIGGSALVFAAALGLVRSQATVGDRSYLRAMIPHHSIAILTSERAQIEDPRVRRLADEIVEAQRREIAEMRYLVAALGDPEVAPAAIDASALTEAEIAAVLPGPAACQFRRAAGSGPILAALAPVGSSEAVGVVKLGGRLVRVAGRGFGAGELASGAELAADGVRVVVSPSDDGGADLRFTLAEGRTVAYRGVYRCGP